MTQEDYSSNTTLHDQWGKEVIRIDKEGFHYNGQFIADAGEAHRLMVEFLKQNTVLNPGVTLAEIEQREQRIDTHSAWVQDGVVNMANNDDPFYVEVFKTRKELEQFITYMLLKADEAWPNH